MTTSQQPGYETRDISLKNIWRIGIISIVLLILIVIGVHQYFISAKENQIYNTVLQPPSKELIELHAYEDSILTTYGQSTEPGYYRIPIDRAMKILVQQATEANKGD